MRLVQFRHPKLGLRVGYLLPDDETVVDITFPRAYLGSTRAWLIAAAGAHKPMAELVETRMQGHLERGAKAQAANEYEYAALYAAAWAGDTSVPYLVAPITPPEVWGAGVTYRRSADFRVDETGDAPQNMYDRVYSAERPELFFKATATHVVGPGDAIRVRSDSAFTAPEPELALVLDAAGGIAGYTLANDVSAWDIERDNALYLAQSKIFLGCCALGPIFVTPDALDDPLDIAITLRVVRPDDAAESGSGGEDADEYPLLAVPERVTGEIVFAGAANTGQLHRSFAELIAWLLRDNAIPHGTVLCTGTGIIVPTDAPLRPGYIVDIAAGPLGVLRNRVR